MVRGRFSDRHKVSFPAVSWSVSRPYEGRFSVRQLVGKLYHWDRRHFHIQTVGGRKARPSAFQQPGSVQFVQCALYGGAAFIQHFRYLCYGVDNVCPSLAVLPAVLLRKGGTV
ncbi:MAG: hypothetical protein ACLTHF_07430 [Fusicatenibacter saccharivorans]